MHSSHYRQTTRRRFLSSLAMGAGAISLVSVSTPLALAASPEDPPFDPASDADQWFNKIKGKHRIVFDVTQPNGIFPFAWPRVFLDTNNITGSPEKSSSEVVIFRSHAIPFALEDRLWDKYKLGEMFKITDPVAKTPAVRNMFWNPKEGDFVIPGMGNVHIGINELQESGVMFCACNMAITTSSAIVAQKSNLDPAEVKKEWLAGVLPGIQVVPSGVWAVGRAQEHGCAYCFAG